MNALQAEVVVLGVPDYIRVGRWVVCPIAVGEDKWRAARIMQVGGDDSPGPTSIYLSLGWWQQASWFPLERVFGTENEARVWIAENKANEYEKMYHAEHTAHRRTARQLQAMKKVLDSFKIPHD